MAAPNHPQGLPVVLELAALPREQVGPFIILGIDKTAGKEQIEAAWAQRVIWARKERIKTPLEDINWAREVINDHDRRIRADAASLNMDTSEGVLRRLRERFAGLAKNEQGCRPLDVELPLADYSPAIPVPDIAQERQAIPVGEVPLEIPAVAVLVEELLREPLDPWKLDIGEPSSPSTPDLPSTPEGAPG
jgi:hypothetical protein